MSYNSILKAYLKALQEQYKNATNSRQYTAELSYRMPLDTMERALAKEFNPADDIDVILEPTTQGRVGRPDWRIHNKDTMGIYGYIEGKGLSEEPFDIRLILSRLVDTFSSRILYPMLLLSGNHSIAVV